MKLLDFAALIVQIAGTLLMALNAPSNRPAGAYVYSANDDFGRIKRRNRNTKIGLVILCSGFFIQLLSQTLHSFIIPV